MPMFAYQALSRTGEELSGKMQAENTNAVAQALRTEGLRVLDIKEKRRSGFLGQDNFSDWYATQRSASTDALIFFYRQMAFMLRAGLPLAECIQLAATQVSSPRLNFALRKMHRDIEAGQSLSSALRKHPDVFSNIAINLVVAGESTGELDVIMDRLAIHLEKKSQLRKQMINAMIYPVVVILAAIGVAVFMVTMIIPKFAQFIQGRGKRLPESTQTLIDGAAFLRENGLTIIGVMIAIMILILITYKTYPGRRWIDRILLSTPVFGKLIIYGSMSQMNWASSILMRSGITIFETLKITADLIANKIYSDKLKRASESVMAGRDLASSIQHPQMPSLVTHMIAIGERTGSLDRIQQELGIYYQNLLEIGIKRLSAMLEPAMILIIGGMVGFVYYAFFQALFALAA
ncbi:type II secretion system F family protein [Methylophaga sp. OBS1]|uniref:type II secretion system F family protein n=1 Tax=Methylophaga sp. OBS1 TaxID=2991933 RepID=UPI002250544E|nr:type II secretion system F family protein [Methylophaga sp. OBS1]MCX4190962.1 type II secretion system F family protein [Methylophaga sp. OBS1]MCX4192092.1 type II secretion system F family protein [Methylophaga sp. OBS1]